ncbi:MAG TPA: NAD-dependent epimerase/dehydratase family protein [Polyangiaceae bacterium]
MRVLLTGGHGFIGSRVTRLLLERGDTVRCLLREGSVTRRIDDLAFERAPGDVRDAATLAGAMDGVEACVHLASPSGWQEIRSNALEATIVDGTRNLLAAARQHGVRRFLYVSSVAAINAAFRPTTFDENSPFELEGSTLRYAIAKHHAERLCREACGSGLDTVIVNPGEVYGPDDDALVTAGNLKDALTSWPALACHGGNPVCHVDDVADGIVKALDRGRTGERYILGGDNVHVKDTVRLTLELAGKQTPVLVMPNGLLKAFLRVLQALRLPTPVEPEVIQYATRYWFVDSSKAARELGYSPRGARETLAPTVAWLYRAGHVKGAPPARLLTTSE